MNTMHLCQVVAYDLLLMEVARQKHFKIRVLVYFKVIIIIYNYNIM